MSYRPRVGDLVCVAACCGCVGIKVACEEYTGFYIPYKVSVDLVGYLTVELNTDVLAVKVIYVADFLGSLEVVDVSGNLSVRVNVC